MKLDNKTIFSILLVLLFVGSIFAIMTTGGDRAKPGSDINSDLNVNLTPVNYNAQFDANVLEVFPQIIVAGKPVDYDQASIDNKLLELQGLKSKNVSFRQTEDGSINVVITLNILADKKQEIVSKIKELNIIEEPIEMYQYALLSVPAEVNFTNDNNQEILYSFGATPIEGIINIETIKEDNIFVACYATFSGQKLLSATGIEMYNLSSYPQMLISSGDFNVIGYDAKILLDAQTTLIYSKDKKEIEEKIKTDYNDTEITFSFSQNLMFTIPEDKNTEELGIALDNLRDENKFSNYSLNEEDLSLEVYLNEDTKDNEYQELKTQIKEISGATVITNEPKTNISAILNYENIDISKINNILEKYGFTDIKYKTIANVDTSNLIIENKKYNYEETSTQALVDYPQDLNKTTLTLQIQAYVQRDNILYLGLQK